MTTFSTLSRFRKPTRPAFGLGIAEGTRIVRSWQEGPVSCELVQDDQWWESEDGRLLYTLHLLAPGRVETEDFMDAADAYGRALTIARELEFEAFVAEEKERAANDNEASLGRLAPISGGVARTGRGVRRDGVLLPPRHP